MTEFRKPTAASTASACSSRLLKNATDFDKRPRRCNSVFLMKKHIFSFCIEKKQTFNLLLFLRENERKHEKEEMSNLFILFFACLLKIEIVIKFLDDRFQCRQNHIFLQNNIDSSSITLLVSHGSKNRKRLCVVRTNARMSIFITDGTLNAFRFLVLAQMQQQACKVSKAKDVPKIVE